MARKTPIVGIIRALFARSGNQCAFPGCNHLLINEKNQFISQVCHIEAANAEGQRYNPHQDDEQRRAYENLLLLCYAHHIETNDESLFPVETLKKIKKQHEESFNNTFTIDINLAQKISSDIERFWDKIDNLKLTREFRDFAVELDTQASFCILLEDIRELIKRINTEANELCMYVDSNWDNILTFLKKNNIDTSPLDTIPYCDNPFFQAYWETINLAIPNSFTYLEVVLTHLSIKHYELAIVHNPTNIEFKRTLNELQKTLEYQVSSYSLAD